MPGKQMAIDADLSSGLISEQQAKERRQKIQREADFYGAMDGATKIVKGDAVMSLITTAVNLIGGSIIGIVQSGKRISGRGWGEDELYGLHPVTWEDVKLKADKGDRKSVV